MIIEWLETKEVTPTQARLAKNIAMIVNAGTFGCLAGAITLQQEISGCVLLLVAFLECVSFAVYGTARHIQGLLGVELKDGA